ncbi:MAG: M1 family metallopeptidase [Candidatus Aminicenantes bacterium]|nr:M1 family metallopeptidase [Candidatus Aminicenantes bacterium]
MKTKLWPAGVAMFLALSLSSRSDTLCPQVANYTMDVRLDTARKVITGREVLMWTNTSPDTLKSLWFHLYWNAFANNATTFMTEGGASRQDPVRHFKKEDWGWIRVDSIKILKDPALEGFDLKPGLTFQHPDDINDMDRTVASVDLPRPMAPGETIVLEIRWEGQVPRPISRTGVINDYYFLGQWFPKIGVYLDGRWNCHQFHGSSEFFADYGTYDVRLTLPASFVVGATGRRLELTRNADGTACHRFTQDSVHDFAWTASPRFLEYHQRFDFAPGRSAEIILLLQPEHRRLKERYLKAVMSALKQASLLLGDYPYETITCVDPAYNSRSGGMEYPTIFTAGAGFLDPEGSGDPEAVTIHEFGHGYFYGLVGSNEFENPWMDEGFATFLESKIYDLAYGPRTYTRTYFGIPVLFRGVTIPIESSGISDVRRTAGRDVMQRYAWHFRDAESYDANSYAKGEIMLRTLERLLGEKAFAAMMRDYSRSNWFGHPRPKDFYETVSRHAGRDMSGLLDQFIYGAGVCDYAVGRIDNRHPQPLRGWLDGKLLENTPLPGSAQAFESEVVVQRLGDIRIPVDVLVKFEGGRTLRETWDGQYLWKRFRYRGRAPIIQAVVDPDFKLVADINRTNNSLSREPNGLAPWKWTVHWLGWLQHALEFFVIFGG